MPFYIFYGRQADAVIKKLGNCSILPIHRLAGESVMLKRKNKTPFGRIKSETELIEFAYPFDLELSDFLYLLYHIQMGRLWKDRISLHT